MVDASEPEKIAAATAAFADLINAGRQHASAESFEAAHDVYAEAVRMFPLHPQGYLERGSVRSLLGDMAGAVDDLGIALVLAEPEEDMLRAHFNRGSALLEIRQSPAALVHFEVAAAAGVKDADRLLVRARTEAGRESAASENAAQAYCARGFELLPRAPFVALACFEDARHLDASLLWAVHGAGQANGAIGRPHHARKAFSQVLERGAKGVMRAEALFNRASLLPADASDVDRAQARADFEGCLEMAQDRTVGFPPTADPIQADAMLDAIAAKLAAISGPESN
ncbi:MAG: hypothetical protein KUG77_21625 [Nannocystaceae bacterium]|nr:hypothetical protein [Nannocystaceae bacterium]